MNILYVKLQGGLGNQLYQMFFGFELGRILNRKVIFDYTRLIDGFDERPEDLKHTHLTLDLYNTQLESYQCFSHHGWERDKDFHYFTEPRINDTENYNNFWFNIRKGIEILQSVPKHKVIYVDGHWQSYPYERHQISYMKKFLDKIEAKESDVKYAIENSEISCCINVRRGDYLTHYKDFFHHCSMENFYTPAIEALDETCSGKKVNYFIFSNDVEWCKENFKGDNMTVVDHQYAGKSFTEYLDLMRRCKYFIIPNSTFAIWAAITAKDLQSVFVPDKWFVDKDESINPLDDSIFKASTDFWYRIISDPTNI
jgi:hypothetical protein